MEMGDIDDDANVRKRRRRSIRNLRRRSGIVPFSLGEESASTEQQETACKEEAVKDDPYGSLWMESEEPVKIKKRRRSNLVTDLPRPPSALEEVDMNSVDNEADSNRDKLESEYHRSEFGSDAKEIRETLRDNSQLGEDGGYKMNCGSTGIRPEYKCYEKSMNAIPAEVFDSNLKNSDPRLSPEQSQKLFQTDTTENKVETQTDSKSTPPDDIQLTTPQSMSPEFPMSPSDIVYLENHDDSYIGFLQTNENIIESKIGAGSKLNDIIVRDKSIEGRNKTVLRKNEEENDKLDASMQSVDASVSDKEDTVLSLSDKENTVIENKSADQIDEGRPSDSPGFLSLCKAFAGKVVDLVKTSPSYLSNILQDSKTENSESPLTKDVIAETSPDKQKESYTDIKLVLETQLNKSIEKKVQSPKKFVQVYSVTEVLKDDDRCDNEEKPCEVVEENLRKEADAKVTKSKQEKTKNKRRKSSSKMFLETFAAVSNELSKASSSAESEKSQQTDEMDSFREEIDCASTSNAAISLEIKTVLDQDTNRNITCHISNRPIPLKTASVEEHLIKNNITDTHKSESSNSEVNESNEKSVKTKKTRTPRKRRSADFKIVNEEQPSKQKHFRVENANSLSRTKPDTNDKSNHASPFTQIKCIESNTESETITVTNTVESSSSCVVTNSSSESSFEKNSTVDGSDKSASCAIVETNNTVDFTDSTSSVLEGLSNLDLDVVIPEPGSFGDDKTKIKRDRRRRRSNNFYFPSIYNDAEEKQNETCITECVTTRIDHVNTESSKTVNIIRPKEPVQDSRINEVTEEISNVRINDWNSKENSGKKSVVRLPDIAEDAEPELNNLDEGQNKTNSSNIGMIFKVDDVKSSEQSNVSTENIDDAAPRRRRRRSADAASLKIQMHALESGNSLLTEQPASSPGPSTKQGRKRKKEQEIPLEDIYRNKNYVKPQDKTWETIFESPKTDDQLFSKRKLHTYLNFEDNYYKPTQEKVKKRQKRAMKNGWDSKKRKRQAIPENDFQVKISNIFSELDEEEGCSISDKIKETIGY